MERRGIHHSLTMHDMPLIDRMLDAGEEVGARGGGSEPTMTERAMSFVFKKHGGAAADTAVPASRL